LSLPHFILKKDMLHYIYIIFAEFFRLAQPDALFSQAAAPGCTAQDVCCFPVCFCRSCKKFSQDSPFQSSATGCPANYKKKVLLN
jgi:hypothetical protein